MTGEISAVNSGTVTASAGFLVPGIITSCTFPACSGPSVRNITCRTLWAVVVTMVARNSGTATASAFTSDVGRWRKLGDWRSRSNFVLAEPAERDHLDAAAEPLVGLGGGLDFR